MGPAPHLVTARNEIALPRGPTHGARMRFARIAMATLGLTAVAAAGCASHEEPVREPVAAKPAPERVVEVRREAYQPGTLQRPNLSAEWNWNGQALPTGDPATSVVTIEKISPATVNVNQEYDYTIRVTNIAKTLDLVDVAVLDALPEEGYEFRSADPVGEISGRMLRWTLGSLPPGASREISVRGRATREGSVGKCAFVEYTPRVCVATQVVAPALELERFAPAAIVQCDDIPLRFVIRNPGSGPATNVRIADELPDGWTVAGSRTLRFDVGTLAPGESRELTAMARSARTGEFVVRARAVGDGDLDAEASAKVAVRKPELEITTVASKETPLLGTGTVFTVTVRNVGDWPARDFVLSDTVSGAEDIVAVSHGGRVAGTEVSWSLGDLEPGAKHAVSFTVKRSTEGAVVAQAAANAYCAEAVSAAARTLYQGIPAVLVEVVDDSDPLPIGSNTTYTITVTNQGSAADTDIVVRCGWEDAMEFVTASGATRPTQAGRDLTFGALNSLAPKDVAVWKVTLRGVKDADTRFTVTVDTHETDRPIQETEATRVFRFED